MLDLAARLAWRGWGHVEPNPMVGCVITTPSGEILGAGHHQRYGGPHAEVEAIRCCERNGNSPRGATVYVTLEPCSHTGKTGPCADALIEAGVGRVVYAIADPGPASRGGAERLRAAGIDADEKSSSWRAVEASAPFRKRVATGLPWVIAKWAQSIDGKIATSGGESQWISNELSRRFVHRMRGRVDAILTAIGTVEADDPRLTARGVTVRRAARRVVLDADARLSDGSALIRTIDEAPLTVVSAADPGRLRSLGAEVIRAPSSERGVDLRAALRALVERHEAMTVMIEAGPRVLGSLLAEDLIDEAHVFTGPMAFGDPAAPGPLDAGALSSLAGATRFRLLNLRRRGDDIHAVYRR